MAIKADEQLLALDAVVFLLTIDATGIGGSVLRIATGNKDGAAVSFGGVSYRALPCRVTGLRLGGTRPAEPLLEVAEEDAMLMSLTAGREDLSGATVTRLRTLKKYLDGEPGADATQHWPADTWRITGSAKREKAVVAWRLGSFLATDSAYLPGREVLRDVCSWRYRRHDESMPDKFDYTNAQCPYRGEGTYNNRDEVVSNAAADVCSRRLSGCQLRFGMAAELPFGGFAGVGRGQQ